MQLREEKSELYVSVDENASNYSLWADYHVHDEITVPLSELLVNNTKVICRLHYL